MLLSLDGTFLVQILNFVVFWVILNYVFIRPTRRAIEERQEIVAGLARDAREAAAKAAELNRQADAVLEEARRKAGDVIRTGQAEGAAQAHYIERRASEEAAATVALAHAAVASERAAAEAQQAPFVTELARAMVSAATGMESAA